MKKVILLDPACYLPLRIPVTPAAIEELTLCEWGSFEDAGCPKSGHVVNVLLKRKTRIVIETVEELRLVWEAINSGLFGEPGHVSENFGRTAKKLKDDLRPFAELGAMRYTERGARAADERRFWEHWDRSSEEAREAIMKKVSVVGFEPGTSDEIPSGTKHTIYSRFARAERGVQ